MLKHLKILDINGIYDALCFQENYLEDVDKIINIFSTISEENIFSFETRFFFEIIISNYLKFIFSYYRQYYFFLINYKKL